MSPVWRGVAKVNVPSAFTGRLSAPLSCKTRPLPARPLTVPPIVNELVQWTTTVVTFAMATVPVPAPTVHDCVGLLGCVRTVTS